MKKCATLLSILLISIFVSNVSPKYKEMRVKNDTLTKENLWKYIVEQCGTDQEIILRQAILETGWLTSNISKTHNNLFGLTNLKGYYKFNHWTESVLFYRERILKRKKGDDYYTYLSNMGYAEDKDYIKKLKNIDLNKFFNKI